MSVTADHCLGFIYVISWSVSMYAPVITNWKYKSASAVSVDFVMLNIAGYMYLTCSMFLQLYAWLPAATGSGGDLMSELVTKPKVSDFDLLYTSHGFILNLILSSQLYVPNLWRFKIEKRPHMKKNYERILYTSLVIFSLLVMEFMYYNENVGWNNNRTLSFCNKLFLMKISMSLLKYLPQVKHNYERKTLKGFSISGIFLDVIGGIASLLQLIIEINNDGDFSFIVFVTNFGKIGLGLVTLIFDFIFISQWSIYGG